MHTFHYETESHAFHLPLPFGKKKKEVIEYNRLIKSSQTFILIHPFTQQLFMEEKNAIKMQRILKTRS